MGTLSVDRHEISVDTLRTRINRTKYVKYLKDYVNDDKHSHSWLQRRLSAVVVFRGRNLIGSPSRRSVGKSEKILSEKTSAVGAVKFVFGLAKTYGCMADRNGLKVIRLNKNRDETIPHRWVERRKRKRRRRKKGETCDCGWSWKKK